ncbi:hypothetical protein KL911_002733 [Ogataea haglerorum]|uniref:uncharacterized protein n=1 Tax=Ogataea haglerorum TaxID=1937702 RepID=UPI001C8AF57C|nr:uncharacterized protein KL911_002733 [Ogataea haglerorum]KAG7753340.1 hypothetical protein KL911_002733 [Ogataea haglerorum]KAG7801967.1 hypothetical protein KL944_003035 [Ogataea haglerorum]
MSSAQSANSASPASVERLHDRFNQKSAVTGEGKHQDVGPEAFSGKENGHDQSQPPQDEEYRNATECWRDEDSRAVPTPTARRTGRLSLFSFKGTHNEPAAEQANEEKEPFQKKILKGIKRATTRGDPVRNSTAYGQIDHSHELEYKSHMKTRWLIDANILGYTDAFIIATYFMSDERGTRRVPLLLQMLSLTLTDVSTNVHTKKRKFRIDLDYAVGSQYLRWSLEKTSRDLAVLHNRLRLMILQENVLQKGHKEIELPKFPKYKNQTTYSKLKQGVNREETNASSIMLPNDETPTAYYRANSSQSSDDGENTSMFSVRSSLRRHGFFKRKPNDILTNEHFRDAMQDYLDNLIRAFNLRPQANRIFQFFELSPIGMLLSYETGRKRKEGYLLIKTTAKAQGWRVGHLKARELKAMVERHIAKWFILGHSYIMYVADINSTTPLDVFLIDSSFKFTLSGFGDAPVTLHNLSEFVKQQLKAEEEEEDDDEDGYVEDPAPMHKSYLSLTLENSERKLSVMGKSANQMKRWCVAIHETAKETIWSRKHRFESFAPVRDKVFAKWFVDARDYMWAVSAAIEMAKDVIYIHDWWLSPELYLRRPANGNQEWRLDRLLKRKAEEGIKIFVIVYRNVANTVQTDSLWTKHSLLDLHPNVYVLRSPNQLMQNVYFWAHHEKLVIIDHTVCFVGGIDLCYGRYDTPDHSVVDDAPCAFDPIPPNSASSTGNAFSYQIYPGKDYSNPRICDFFELNQPFEDMIDRQSVPRMPWHDVHMMTCGHIARDLSRHFVQRWNFLLRQKRPSRLTPLLLPPRDFTDQEIEELGLTGTCEVQVLRSSCSWSLGLQEPEQSIHNAYLRLIETSEHFIYIENQFFVSSHEHDGVVIKNKIGDALVERIIRAHANKESWKAVIVIPLMPGFKSQVDSKEASSIRVIMQCQYMSISMGETSIFARLRRAGIRPEDYIQFYSLRKWGYIGRRKSLTTEQLYVHAKTMVVDDRIAIIGSANINERSMRGTRDSEICTIVRDKEMIDTFMDGKPYRAAKFAHTLRMRQMREHLGVDVDLLELVERRFSQIEKFACTPQGLTSVTSKAGDQKLSAMVELAARYVLDLPDGTPRFKSGSTASKTGGAELTKKLTDSFRNDYDDALSDNLDQIPYVFSFNHRAGEENPGIREKKAFSSDSRVTDKAHRSEVKGYGPDKYQSATHVNSKSKNTKLLAEWASSSSSDTHQTLPCIEDVLEFITNDDKNLPIDVLNHQRWDMLKRLHYLQKLLNKRKRESENASASNKEDVGNFSSGTENGYPESSLVKLPRFPTTSLSDADVEDLSANFLPRVSQVFVDPYSFEDPLDIDFYEGLWMPQALRNTMIYQMVFHVQPDDTVQTWSDYKMFQELKESFLLHQRASHGGATAADGEHGGTELLSEELSPETANDSHGSNESLTSSTGIQTQPPLSSDTDEAQMDSLRYAIRRSKIAELERYSRPGVSNSYNRSKINSLMGVPSVYDYESAEKLLKLITGHLVIFPTKWLQKEVESSNWFYTADKLPPVQIYN